MLSTSVYQLTLSPYLGNMLKKTNPPVLLITPLQHKRELFWKHLIKLPFRSTNIFHKEHLPFRLFLPVHIFFLFLFGLVWIEFWWVFFFLNRSPEGRSKIPQHLLFQKSLGVPMVEQVLVGHNVSRKKKAYSWPKPRPTLACRLTISVSRRKARM